MEILGYSDMTWIAAIAFVLCLAFGLYMVISKKPGFVRGFKNTADYRDKEQYAVKGGWLILALAGVCLIMLIISFFNDMISNIIGFAGLCVFGYFWKKMSDEFGPV